MKRHLLLALVLSTLVTSVHAGCPELKSAIDAKIQAKGVRNYSLDVVAAADVGSGKVVGECEGGEKKLVYARGASQASAGAAPVPKPKPKPARAAKPAAKVPALGNY